MIPNYAKLTIKQFLKCKQISELESDPIDKNIKLLSEVTGKPIEYFENLPLGELKDNLYKLAQIESLHENSKVHMKFKIKGKRFEVIWREQELTAAQYIDVCAFTKDPEQILYNIHNILASICVERTWYGKRLKYDGAKHKDIAELFYNHMTIEQAYPIMLFFCRYYEALAESIETYLSKEVEELKQHLQTFGANTVG